MTAQQTALALSIAGLLIGVGGFLSQPENLALLSRGQSHIAASIGAVLYVGGQALEHALTRKDVQQNAANIAAVQLTAGTSTSNPATNDRPKPAS